MFAAIGRAAPLMSRPCRRNREVRQSVTANVSQALPPKHTFSIRLPCFMLFLPPPVRGRRASAAAPPFVAQKCQARCPNLEKNLPCAQEIVVARVKLKTSELHNIIRSTPSVRSATIILLPRESDHLPDRWPNTARPDIPCGAPETDALASKRWQTGTVRSGS